MVIFQSAYCYVASATTIQEKIAKIDLIIDSLLDTALKAVANGNISDYMLNDGQTVIKTGYRSPDAVTKSIEELEKIREMYVVKLNRNNNGNVVRLIDSKNLR